MEGFSQQIGAWIPFFTTLAVLCATLAGLLFVALSLHVGVLKAEGGVNLRRLAQQTFGDFVQVLFIGTFFIVPFDKPQFFGLAALMIVVAGLKESGGRFWQAWSDRNHPEHRAYFMRRFAMSLLGRALLAGGGAGLLFGVVGGVQARQDLLFIFSGSVVLMIAALRNAWFLLVHELGEQ
ncbi:MAG TPA: hypothetical protein VF651_01700 [Gammaproteobacteria bacterium]